LWLNPHLTPAFDTRGGQDLAELQGSPASKQMQASIQPPLHCDLRLRPRHRLLGTGGLIRATLMPAGPVVGNGPGCLFHTYTSAAVRIGQAAREAGLDITGATSLVGANPLCRGEACSAQAGRGEDLVDLRTAGGGFHGHVLLQTAGM